MISFNNDDFPPAGRPAEKSFKIFQNPKFPKIITVTTTTTTTTTTTAGL